MFKSKLKLAIVISLAGLMMGVSNSVFANLVKGIYLTQTTLENTKYLTYLIKEAKAAGIDTFVIDLEMQSKKAAANIALVKENKLHYVARIIVFPEGGHPEQITSPSYWAKRYNLVEAAVKYGAEQIQLDYIRYNTRQPASSQNAKDILKVIQWFKNKLKSSGIPLQADVFGISSFGESKHIGQNLRLMSQTLDALCPMVYPSHFEPYKEAAVTPYKTIYRSLTALRAQFDNKPPLKIYAFIEISNYRFPLPNDKRRDYVIAEMKAVRDAHVDGWYVWSAHNKYDFLFTLMKDLNKKGSSRKILEANDETMTKPDFHADDNLMTLSAQSNSNSLIWTWVKTTQLTDL